MHKLILLRHGESQWNLENRFTGWTDVDLSKNGIDEAKKAGCNAIKFQSFKAENRVSKKVKSVNYAEKADGLQENIYEMFKRLSLSFSDTKKIFEYA